MQKRNLFILTLLTMVFVQNTVFAQNWIVMEEYKYDCWLAVSDPDELVKTIKDEVWKYKVFKEDDIKTALDNLKSYCGKKWYIKESWWSDEVPESPRLMDHLIDVWYRKLDGISELAYWELDKDGEERRKKIKEIAEDPKWKKPWEIFDLFNESRDVKLENQDKLAQKYKYVCDEAFSSRMWMLNMFSEETMKIWFDRCMSLANHRINSEIRYMKAVMVNKWIKYLVDAIHNYIMDYYSEEKLPKVLEKMAEVQWALWNWVQKTNWAGYCSSWWQ